MNYTTLRAEQIAAYAESSCAEMEADVSAGDILDRLKNGKAVLEVRSFGFAVLKLKPGVEGRLMPHLWLLYIDPSQRGLRNGHRFVQQLLSKYSRYYAMTVHCYGSRRRAFFGRLGFRIESREGQLRVMTTSEVR